MTGMTLPGWVYQDEEFFALEKEAIFLRTWQLVGHISEVENPGDFLRFDLLGESALVVRDPRGRLQAYYNVCRHRGSRLVDRSAGHCAGLIHCPYHGFSYDLDGQLVAVEGVEDFDGLNKRELGLIPVELDVYLGFIFVRFLSDDGPSVAEQLAPFDDILQRYLPVEMSPLTPVTSSTVPANWKVAVENSLEAYHVSTAHPGLKRLYAGTYTFDVQPLGVSRGGGTIDAHDSSVWSERLYHRLLPDAPHLPLDRKRAWHYYGLFPNLTLALYPDQIAFHQILPLGSEVCLKRTGAYALADNRPEMRAARYLNARINRRVAEEDRLLIESVQAGVRSRGYLPGPLSRREARVHQFQSLIRERLPVATCPELPKTGQVGVRNRELGGRAPARAKAFARV